MLDNTSIFLTCILLLVVIHRAAKLVRQEVKKNKEGGFRCAADLKRKKDERNPDLVDGKVI